MKVTKILSVLFGLLGVLILAAAVALSFSSLDAPVQLLAVSDGAEQCTVEYMDALCRGDLETVGSLTSGQPRYIAGSEPDTQLAGLLWEAYAGSLSCDFSGGCYASASGLSRDVQVTVLDIPGVLQILKERSQALLEQHAAVTDQDLVFDGDGQYREEFAMGVLYDGTAAILEEGGVTRTIDLTLELSCQDGRWYVLPNPAVTDLLAGSMGA